MRAVSELAEKEATGWLGIACDFERRLTQAEKRIARLSAPITVNDLNEHGLGYIAGDKQAYAEAFNAIIAARAKEQP